ncbi:hypothetical protein PHYBLDRAFT_142644 [Phycomyces blakesleeanus NRRL 1555(-)]|uniref:Protein-S-isoprenylcysteine O-methyltransferase n=2 Tax=Phycomyces blakesleeanus TaxID=4837 RepID=A0A167P2N9_PHYB8|nr:hypothetical protein PHYBLDRAFT_142644 [Phycomyces blakesleeanus NRRL 1555(-)]OAD77131.1 hypothetical protein PHYBLDRAFT_142644 [Phycomyces blakesleeanus NRRL 1555(-)]|eukprot:XP_018295171.1 hypothetical protein PHYBLDRAFT_142644 [Phycomyces blakesleeanus NRRL 1555(-)]
MLSILLGYVLVASLVLVEHRYESPRTTTGLQLSGDDRGSTHLLWLTWLVVLAIAPLLCLITLASAPQWIGWMGLCWIVSGIGLLRWAMHVNPFYLRAVATTDDQYICIDGPYKVIRHPGYMAFLLAWVGFGLAISNWFSFGVVLIVAVYSCVRRIQAEEQMMMDVFGVDYQQYADETYK